MNEEEVASVRQAIEHIAESVKSIQHDMGLNDQGFFVLLQYHTKLPLKVCKQVIAACHALEDAYLAKSK
jgi:hypothetical protein